MISDFELTMPWGNCDGIEGRARSEENRQQLHISDFQHLSAPREVILALLMPAPDDPAASVSEPAAYPFFENEPADTNDCRICGAHGRTNTHRDVHSRHSAGIVRVAADEPRENRVRGRAGKRWAAYQEGKVRLEGEELEFAKDGKEVKRGTLKPASRDGRFEEAAVNACVLRCCYCVLLLRFATAHAPVSLAGRSCLVVFLCSVFGEGGGLGFEREEEGRCGVYLCSRALAVRQKRRGVVCDRARALAAKRGKGGLCIG